MPYHKCGEEAWSLSRSLFGFTARTKTPTTNKTNHILSDAQDKKSTLAETCTRGTNHRGPSQENTQHSNHNKTNNDNATTSVNIHNNSVLPNTNANANANANANISNHISNSDNTLKVRNMGGYSDSGWYRDDSDQHSCGSNEDSSNSQLQQAQDDMSMASHSMFDDKERFIRKARSDNDDTDDDDDDYDGDDYDDDDGAKRRTVGIPCAIIGCLGCAVLVVFLVGLVMQLVNQEDRLSTSLQQSRAGVDQTGPTAQDADGLDVFFPSSADLTPCDRDPNCQTIIDLLEEKGMETTKPCQILARDWLRSNQEFASFTDERIYQRYAMATFFCETDGPNWAQNHNWISDTEHECDWVTTLDNRIDACNHQEQLRVLRLEDNELHGSLPSELSLLTTLFELTVSGNFLRGKVPTDLAQLTDLDTLCMSLNMFEEGPVPEFLFEFEDMVYLDLAFNSWSGTIPTTIAATSPGIEILYAEGNRLSGTIPPEIGQLPLRRLSLSGNELTGELPLDALTVDNSTLERVHVHDNKLEGWVGGLDLFLSKSTALTTMSLHKNANLQGTITMCGEERQISVYDTQINCPCCSSSVTPDGDDN